MYQYENKNEHRSLEENINLSDLVEATIKYVTDFQWNEEKSWANIEELYRAEKGVEA